MASRLAAALTQDKPPKLDKLEAAAEILSKAASEGKVHAAALCVRQGKYEFARSFGAARSPDDIFLLASITKPMSVAALMTLYDQGQFRLADPVKKFLPEFTGGQRDDVTVLHLLSHVSGLPDQLPENDALRRGHAKLSQFVEQAIRTPLLFQPGSQYRYSSMGILLASEIARRITGTEFSAFVDKTVLQPLAMKHSAFGLGRFKLDQTMRCQVEKAAPESGGGDPKAKNWDWNSPFWRNLAAPWGGAHGSAPDVARFLAEFLHQEGKCVKPETARLMLQNHNPAGLTPRGLGFAVGRGAGSRHCSEKTFGHNGATGTLAWADPATNTICVVLTTLPERAVNPHPGRLASDQVAEAAA
jgi:CubicO group peptidase (beta-lactamase class C family)